MNRRIALLPLLALAGTSLSGCVAVAIPALAGSAIVGTRIDGEGSDTPVPAPPAQAAAVAAPPQARAAAPALAAAPAASPAPSAAAAPAAPPAPKIAPESRPAALPPAAAGAAAASFPPAAPATAAAPSAPSANASGFARFVRYGRGIAAVSAQASGPLSAMLADPVALDGMRKRCAADQQPVAVIDLNPAGGTFVPPAILEKQTGLALGLAVLREAGVQIAWVSDVPVSQIGAVRTTLEQSGLDPRGEDIVSLRRDPDDRKQARKESLAATACVVAIAGDEKPDFDERFRYLKNPEAGTALEAAINDGWFLIEPIFPAGN